MWMTLRWICLLTLAVVMPFSPSEADAFIQSSSCCYRGHRKTDEPITLCYEQRSGWGCHSNAYLVKTVSGKWICIKPKSPWIKEKKKMGLPCPLPVFINKRRFEVLDEDAAA
ncbi:C-C motif chemokine 2-like [Morone saxatilis]|uniref:C-C motif chemokine 2-like n=1 Tax=Morone saxatilis TaxID=34816 RepID=UPI0015E1BC11|nr:C-C motif chemokine 2-like [Morone saxatilis]